jgi:8-oxo-dGTP diphosphatase
MTEATICHLMRINGHGEEVLLGLKNKLFLRGIWDGAGGKFRKRETMRTCLRREVREEIGVVIDPKSVTHFASVDFYYPFKDSHNLEWRVHFLRATRWQGEPEPIDGFRELKWFPYSSLPYEIMMTDQRFWVPITLVESTRNRLVTAEVYYGDPDRKTVSKANIRISN